MSLIFLKLGGSLLTDKTAVETVRTQVLSQLAAEIAQAYQLNPHLQLVLGHGSGSFGHVAGAKYGTRQGVSTPAQWRGFAEVSDAAARLNRAVLKALLAAGVTAVALSPSASAITAGGVVQQLAVEPVRQALAAGVLPVVYGDVAFDTVQGGTIISTEEVFGALAHTLRPDYLFLAGETAGVYDLQQTIIPVITPANYEEIKPALGGSRGTDVTGGMASKVRGVFDLLALYPQMQVRIFSGLPAGNTQTLLLNPAAPVGTLLKQN